MVIAKRIDNPKEGLIISKNNVYPPIKCTIEGRRVFIEEKCKGCGSNEVKNYKCAYCRREIFEKIIQWK